MHARNVHLSPFERFNCRGTAEIPSHHSATVLMPPEIITGQKDRGVTTSHGYLLLNDTAVPKQADLHATRRSGGSCPDPTGGNQKAVCGDRIIEHLSQIDDGSDNVSRAHPRDLDANGFLRRFLNRYRVRPLPLDDVFLGKQPEEIFHTTAQSIRKAKSDGCSRKILIGFDGMHRLPRNTGLRGKLDA